MCHTDHSSVCSRALGADGCGAGTTRRSPCRRLDGSTLRCDDGANERRFEWLNTCA